MCMNRLSILFAWLCLQTVLCVSIMSLVCFCQVGGYTSAGRPVTASRCTPVRVETYGPPRTSLARPTNSFIGSTAKRRIFDYDVSEDWGELHVMMLWSLKLRWNRDRIRIGELNKIKSSISTLIFNDTDCPWRFSRNELWWVECDLKSYNVQYSYWCDCILADF